MRRAAETAKPDEARLSEYTSANFPIQRQTLLSNAPIYPELEKLTLTFSLTKLREKVAKEVPEALKIGIQAAVGTLIVFIGLRSAGFIV